MKALVVRDGVNMDIPPVMSEQEYAAQNDLNRLIREENGLPPKAYEPYDPSERLLLDAKP